MPTDLYVSMNGSDSNSGSAAAPFRTILKASQIATPGTTVHVAPGTYAGGFKTMTSGTESAPIHYVSDTKWGADIVPAANSSHDMAWENRGAYVTIDGFEVNGTNYLGGTPWRIGLYSTGSHSAIISNNVHNIAQNVVPSSAGGAGIEGDSWYGGTDIDLIGNVVHDIGPGDSYTIQGIYQTASGNVVNNLVYRASGYGIHLWHDANHVNIVNNTVFNNDKGGIVVGGADFVNTTGPADYVKVENNIVYDNKNYGIIEAGSTGMHNVYTNNLVYDNGTNFRLQNGLVATNTISADPKFVNYIATGGGDYHLAAGSPAIDVGTSSGAPTSDLDGRVRAQGAGYDIGAYEYVLTPILTPLFTGSGDTIDFASARAGSYIAGTQYDALGGDDVVILPVDATAAALAAYDTNQAFHGGSGNDLVVGSTLADSLFGDSGAGTGAAGNDTLDGGIGADSLTGEAGNDIYFVDSLGDQVIEGTGGGTDEIRSTVALAKATAYVENYTFLGSAAVNFIGNSAPNRITGMAVADTLSGAAGDDTLIGDAGSDNLRGGDGSDSLNGGIGNDTLDGAAGNDAMTGGVGNDIYLVDSLGDQIIEDSGGGTDEIRTTVALAKAVAYVENYTFLGSTAVDFIGNSAPNRITGTAAADKLSGAAGDDTLTGSGGNDRFTGGTGNDQIDVSGGNCRILYTSVLDGHDIIGGFDGKAAGGQDVLDLDALFDSLGIAAANRQARLSVDTHAAGVDVRFDMDGNGTFDGVIATLNTTDSISIGGDVVVGA